MQAVQYEILPLLWSSSAHSHHQDTEALLFGFQSIAETIDVNYSDVIPGLTALIPRVNISNVLLADTVMYTIGTPPASSLPCWTVSCRSDSLLPAGRVSG